MRFTEFVKEANVPQPVGGTGAASGVSGMSGATTQPKTVTAPKPVTATKPIQQVTPAGQAAQPSQSSSTVGTTGSSTAPIPKPEDQMGQEPAPAGQPVQPNTQQAQPNPQQDQLRNDAAVMAKRLGMNPQQTQAFTNKVIGTGQTNDPQAIQKALPKPGEKLGQATVMQSPAGSKGIKLDTRNQLGYPVTVDPQDLT
jgi:hypothetical protein